MGIRNLCVTLVAAIVAALGGSACDFIGTRTSQGPAQVQIIAGFGGAAISVWEPTQKKLYLYSLDHNGNPNSCEAYTVEGGSKLPARGKC